MSLADVLNTDVELIGARLRDGVRWWLDELAAVAAPLLRQTRQARPAVTAERRADGAYRIRREGEADRIGPSPGERLAAALVLAPEATLVREVAVPPGLAGRDLARMIVLDFDRLTPFAADAAYYDISTDKARNGGAGGVRLALTPRALADEAVAHALAAGVQPTAVLAADAQAQGCNFLPAMRAAGGAGLARGGTARRLWAVVALMVALNLGVATWRDVQATASLEAAVAAQQPVVAHILAMRRALADLRVEGEAQSRARLAGAPLRVLDALTRATPDAAWVQRMSFDGASVRLAGVRRDGVDMVEALRRDPLFAGVHNADPDASSPADAFDVVAAIAQPSRRGG